MAKYCPECGSEVKETEKFCQECGNDLNSENEITNNEKSSNNKNPEKEITYHKGIWRSTIASLIFPGLGQFINGQILKGIVFIILTFILNVLGNYSLLLSIFYFAFWFYAIYDAYKSAKYINEHNGNYFYNENLKNVDGDVNGN